MSLLNNALREAEQRQSRPEVAGAYTGAVQQNREGPPRLIFLLVLVILVLAGLGVYWFGMTEPAIPENPAVVAQPDPEQGQVERTAVEKPEEDGAVAQQSEAVTEPEPERSLEPEPVPPETPGQDVIVERATPKPEVAQQPLVRAAPPEPEPEPEPETIQAETSAAKAPEMKASEEPAASDPPSVVKTIPQTPEAIDRRTARELETLLANGQMTQAERRLAALTQTQMAPLSRFVLARSLLVDGDVDRALDWLPRDAAAADANLRMLRARALHASGELDAAVATLESNVPAVAELPAYRVTLATLLQQQGQGQEAAAQWAELIAWDDSRAPWWVGLAIALEDQGEVRGAARAYRQAAELPGLPPSLADYVQRRLASLRAG
ncbi:tetratricopeptide repeat protein [Marinobacter halotolerans]|uniref:tetratricopeptide repeat protein n=1 Tax=Marinobacter halotolerans TaxID=1569211 RepID=UPI001246F991|nr:tetratricopeptide repeat protein [Marinobacter halotolerans]